MILPIVKIVTDQEQRLARYESLIGMASCEEEKKALRKAYVSKRPTPIRQYNKEKTDENN